MITVKSFKDIPVERNTLVLCDIDDTVIVFEKLGKKWWRERFVDYYERNGDYEFSETALLKEWIHQIHKEKPVHVDKEGFEDFVERINSTGSILVFITARTSDLYCLTLHHLKQVGITPKTDVHYTNNTPKGDYIANVIDFDDFDHIVFIDDMEHNVNSVKRVFGEKVDTYLFCI
jgi:hypothetical protein